MESSSTGRTISTCTTRKLTTETPRSTTTTPKPSTDTHTASIPMTSATSRTPPRTTVITAFFYELTRSS